MENFELHNNHPRAVRATAGGLHSRQGLWMSNDIVSTRDAVPEWARVREGSSILSFARSGTSDAARVPVRSLSSLVPPSRPFGSLNLTRNYCNYKS